MRARTTSRRTRRARSRRRRAASRRRRSAVAASRAGIFLAAVALVAVLAGSAMFFAGFSLGRQSALTPGTPSGDADAFQPFWDTYSAITDRYAGGDGRPQVARRGRDQGDDRRARRPVLAVPDLGRVPVLAAGDLRPVRGHRRDDRHGRPDRGDRLLHHALGRLPPRGRRAAHGLAGAEGRAAAGRRDRRRSTAPRWRASAWTRRGARSGAPRTRRSRCGSGAGRARRSTSPIVRAVIVQPEVETDTLAGGKVGYIKLAGFSDRSAGEFDDALKAALGRGERQLIVDLRGNPGGFVTAAREIASEFLADGPVFWQQDADGNLTETAARPGGAATDPSIQLVLLVDGGSASASEIVAGRAPRSGTGDAGRHQDLRQGHGPAVDAARGRQRRLPSHDRQVADAGQDVDPRQGHRARRRRQRPAGQARRRSGARRRPQGAGRRARRVRGRSTRRIGRRGDSFRASPAARTTRLHTRAASGRVDMNERR